MLTIRYGETQKVNSVSFLLKANLYITYEKRFFFRVLQNSVMGVSCYHGSDYNYPERKMDGAARSVAL